MMELRMARQIMTTPEGRRLVETLKRMVDNEGLSIEEVVSQSAEHLERMERMARASGFTVKAIADGSLAAFEARLVAEGKLKEPVR